ncbi:MAG TPA: hypothetical protein VFS65_02365 [Candidatus Saccharimonadales bacterium]|nr:hypothetical protein [Candidatus Saccharimonadales bacterium]
MPRRNKPIKHIKQEFTGNNHIKRKFSSEKEAQKAAELQMLMQPSLSLRVYKCNQCNNWHLTRSDSKD